MTQQHGPREKLTLSIERAVLSVWRHIRWHTFRSWLGAHTFIPPGVPAHRWHPLFAYLLALIVQTCFTCVNFLLQQAFPTFRIPILLEAFGVALISLLFGVGPGVFALILSIPPIALKYSPVLPRALGLADLISLLLFVCVGGIICLATVSLERARRVVASLVHQLALQCTRQETILYAIPSIVSIHDQKGKIVQRNAQGEQMQREHHPFFIGDGVEAPTACFTKAGIPLTAEDWPITRALRGEAVNNMEIVSRVSPTEEWVSLMSAVPFYSEQHQLEGIVSVVQDITALRHAQQEEKLEAKARELALQEAAQQMDAFLGIAVHELRTPLSATLMNAQLGLHLLKHEIAQQEGQPEPSGSQEQRDAWKKTATRLAEILGWIEQQGMRQKRLIDDLAEATRIQAERLELHQQPCRLVELVRQEVREQRLHMTERTIIVESQVPEDLFVLADAGRTAQVVNNYLSNALKYSPPTEAVQVRIAFDPQNVREVRVSVIDQGPGLTAEAQKRIWQRFYRVPGAKALSGGGVNLGLGLYLCRTFIERQGGRVGVESQPGQGATFWFALPLFTSENYGTAVEQ